mmetsp:Transcript_11026/g.19932  ORF Transcript_11026/g.19932 Transcript_11026/m.19932 type:complete len:207 (-) Transcript_11026:146-766(-)
MSMEMEPQCLQLMEDWQRDLKEKLMQDRSELTFQFHWVLRQCRLLVQKDRCLVIVSFMVRLEFDSLQNQRILCLGGNINSKRTHRIAYQWTFQMWKVNEERDSLKCAWKCEQRWRCFQGGSIGFSLLNTCDHIERIPTNQIVVSTFRSSSGSTRCSVVDCVFVMSECIHPSPLHDQNRIHLNETVEFQYPMKLFHENSLSNHVSLC